MPDIGPLNPTLRVTIAYPDVPPDCASKLSTLINTIEQAYSQLNTASYLVQGIMGQANGAVQDVACISQGKAAKALVQTWFYSQSDGNQSQNGLSDAATHLNGALSALYEHLPTIQNNMSTLNMVRDNGGTVSRMEADGVQSQMNDLTNALGNISIALQAAAKLINSMNDSWPRVCATGFIPGSSNQPSFTPKSFDNTMHMSGTGGSGITNTSELDPNLPSQLTDEGAVSGGGRSGGDRPLIGSPNSYVTSPAGHVFIYDDQGRLIYDISNQRVKMTVWDKAPNGNFYPRDIKLSGSVPPEYLRLLP